MIKRRSFLLGSVFAAPLIAVAATAAPKVGRRISVIKGDPGERLWAECNADRKNIKILLDGLEAKDCQTADEAEGYVDVLAKSPDGNILLSGNEIMVDRLYGKVEIVITDRPPIKLADVITPDVFRIHNLF